MVNNHLKITIRPKNIVTLVSLAAFILLSSCATVFNAKEYTLDFCAIQPNSSLQVYDSIYQLPAKIKVKRSIDDLPVVLKTDSIEKQFTLKASPNRMTIFANLPFIYLMPVAYTIDHYSGRRYYYGQNIVLDANDTTFVLNKGIFPNYPHRVYDFFNRDYPAQKGQLNIVLGTPVYNNLLIENRYARKKYNFPGGIKAGLEYYYSNRKFLSFNLVYISEVDFPSFDATNDEYTKAYSFYGELKNNFAYKRFDLGYGLNYSLNGLTVVREQITRRQVQSFDVKTRLHNYALGLSAGGNFRFENNIYLGLNYRPSLLLLERNAVKCQYEHLISVELLFKIRVKK